MIMSHDSVQPSSASEVSPRSITMRKLFHALDDEGFRVPTAVSDVCVWWCVCGGVCVGGGGVGVWSLDIFVVLIVLKNPESTNGT